jgi:hypothetical protein
VRVELAETVQNRLNGAQCQRAATTQMKAGGKVQRLLVYLADFCVEFSFSLPPENREFYSRNTKKMG